MRTKTLHQSNIHLERLRKTVPNSPTNKRATVPLCATVTSEDNIRLNKSAQVSFGGFFSVIKTFNDSDKIKLVSKKTGNVLNQLEEIFKDTPQAEKLKNLQVFLSSTDKVGHVPSKKGKIINAFNQVKDIVVQNTESLQKSENNVKNTAILEKLQGFSSELEEAGNLVEETQKNGFVSTKIDKFFEAIGNRPKVQEQFVMRDDGKKNIYSRMDSISETIGTTETLLGLAISLSLKPYSMMKMKGEKKDKKNVVAKVIASALIDLGLTGIMVKPIEKSIKRIDKVIKKGSKEALNDIPEYLMNKDVFKGFKSFKYVSKWPTMIVRAILSIALIPFTLKILNKYVFKDADTSQDSNKNIKAISFTQNSEMERVFKSFTGGSK